MTRLISNSTRSRRAASAEGGTGADDCSTDVLAALLTGLPGRGGAACPSRPPVSYTFLDGGGVGRIGASRRARMAAPPHGALLPLATRRAAPPVAARRPNLPPRAARQRSGAPHRR